MKKILLVAALFSTLSAYSQDIEWNNFGLTIGAGNGFVVTKQLVGGPSFDLRNGVNFGFNWYSKGKRNLKIEAGIHWYHNKLVITPSFYPGIDRTPREYDFQLLSLPIFLRINLSKYFYVSGGLLNDIDVSGHKYITDQTGLGTGAGLGFEFPISKALMIQLSSYTNFHGLFLIKKESDFPQRISDYGIKVGIRTK